MASDLEASELLGKRFDSPDVRSFFARFGVEEELEDDGGILFVDAPAVGVSMNANPETGIVGTIFLYNDRSEEGYAMFRGQIPSGIGFHLDRGEVRGVMSDAPSFTGPDYDTWDLGAYRLNVRYRGAAVRVVSVTVER